MPFVDLYIRRKQGWFLRPELIFPNYFPNSPNMEPEFWVNEQTRRNDRESAWHLLVIVENKNVNRDFDKFKQGMQIALIMYAKCQKRGLRERERERARGQHEEEAVRKSQVSTAKLKFSLLIKIKHHLLHVNNTT